MKERGPFLLLLLIVLIMAGSILYAFFHDDNTMNSLTNEIRDINLHFAAYGNYREEETIKQAITKFLAEYPDINVTYEIAPVPPEATRFDSGFIPGYEHRLLGDFAANNPPDIFFIPLPRGSLYLENGALLDLSPFQDTPQDGFLKYAVGKGEVLVGISAKTKHPEEAYKFVNFFKQDYNAQIAESRQSLLEKAKAGLLTDDALENVDSFKNNWNAVVAAMNRLDLMIYDQPIPRGLIHTFLNNDLTLGWDPYAVLVLNTDNSGYIEHIQLQLSNIHSQNEAVLYKYINLIHILNRTLHPNISEKDLIQICRDLSINLENPSIDFFVMIGSYYYNDIEYTTEGRYDVSDSNGYSYQLRARRKDPRVTFGPRKPHPAYPKP